MIYQKLRLRLLLRLSTLMAFALNLLPTPGRANEPSTNDLKSTLKAALEIFDEDFLSSFSLTLKVTQPSSIKKMHGRSSSIATYYGGKRGQYLQLVNVTRDAVKYDRNAGTSYDEQSNHLLSLDKRVSIALESNSWRVRHDRESFTIAPADKVLTQKSTTPMLVIYPAGHHDAANLYYRYLLALGRGYSQLLDEVTAVQENVDGTCKVTANGKFFSPYSGVWTLEIDPAADFLVRKATFTQAGQATPTFESQSSGQVIGDKLMLSAQGSARIARYGIDVRVVSYGSVPDEKLAKMTHERVAYEETPVPTDAAKVAGYQDLFPKGTLLMDFGSIDSDGMPRVQKHTR